jgi:hypothetical protein
VNRRYPTLFARLVANSVETGDDLHDRGPCWAWLGRIGTWGYPYITVRRGGSPRGVRAHRAMAEEVLGRMLDVRAETIEHVCKTPACVSPWHFKLAPAHVNAARLSLDGLPWMLGAGYVFDPLIPVRVRPTLQSSDCPF